MCQPPRTWRSWVSCSSFVAPVVSHGVTPSIESGFLSLAPWFPVHVCLSASRRQAVHYTPVCTLSLWNLVANETPMRASGELFGGHGWRLRATSRNTLTISRTAGASSPGTETISRSGLPDLGRPRPRLPGLAGLGSSFMFAPNSYFSIAYFERNSSLIQG